MYAPLDGVDLRYLVHPDDAAPARVVEPPFTLGIRLPGQPENLRPERPGRERLGGVEADLLESRDGHAADASGSAAARPASRPGGRGSGSASWTRLRLATAPARPGAEQPPQMAGAPMCRRTSRRTSRHAIVRTSRQPAPGRRRYPGRRRHRARQARSAVVRSDPDATSIRGCDRTRVVRAPWLDHRLPPAQVAPRQRRGYESEPLRRD